MPEHRERVDRRMSGEINRRVLIPLLLDLGARYLLRPYLGSYRDEEKSIRWGLGHHHKKGHRSSVEYQGIHYRDGDLTKGPTRSIEVDRRMVWSVKHDNRLVQNDETRSSKVVTFDESFNKLRTFSSLDLLQRFSSSAKGEVLGIGGSVTSTTEAKAHSEIETETFNRKKTERVLDTSARICYPGPLYRDDKDEDGVVVGRTLVEEGPIWLVERPVSTIHTITPVEQWGIWDARIVLNIEDWAGNFGVMPGGKHDNVLEFAGFSDLQAFMRRDLVLRYKWSTKLKLSDESKRGLDWLADEDNRRVGPVEWEKIVVNDNVSCAGADHHR